MAGTHDPALQEQTQTAVPTDPLSARISLGIPLTPAVNVVQKSSPLCSFQEQTHTVLHDVALLQIFDLLFAPSALLNASSYDMLNHPWVHQLRMKKALALVCKRWNALALPYLYDEICLLRIGQLHALARTVRSAPEAFGPLIRSLRFMCDVPDQFTQITVRNLQYLLAHCSSLRKLFFEEAFALHMSVKMLCGNTDYQELLCDSQAVALKFPQLSQSLIEFTFVDQWLYDRQENPILVPVKLIGTFINLMKLSVSSFSPGDDLYKIDSIRFPALADLTVYVSDNSSRLPEYWYMPKLRQFRVRNRFYSTFISRGLAKLANTRPFFEKHGHKLSYLDLGHWPTEWAALNWIVPLCPHLQHFALQLPANLDPHLIANGSHAVTAMRSIPFIDLFFQQMYTGRNHWHPVLSGSFHQISEEWDKIRLLDSSLLYSIPDLPTLFPPNQTYQAVPGLQTLEFYGLKILWTPDTVYRAELFCEDLERDLPFWTHSIFASAPPGTEDSDSEMEYSEDDSSWSVAAGLRTAAGSGESDSEADCSERDKYHTSDLSSSASSESSLHDGRDEQPEDKISLEDEMQIDMQMLEDEAARWSRPLEFLTEERNVIVQVDEDEAMDVFSAAMTNS